MAKQGRMGGRGCPSCGSHNTWGLGKTGAQLCDTCNYRWHPCGDQYCRGYRVLVEPTPRIIGCPDCDKERGGVPDDVVAWWPEAWAAMSRKLQTRKLESVRVAQ